MRHITRQHMARTTVTLAFFLCLTGFTSASDERQGAQAAHASFTEQATELAHGGGCKWGGVRLFEHEKFNRQKIGFAITRCAPKSGWKWIDLGGTEYNDKISSSVAKKSWKRGKFPRQTYCKHSRGNDSRDCVRILDAKWRTPHWRNMNDQITLIGLCSKNCD